MIALLGFVLECALVGAAAGGAAGLAVWALAALFRPVLARLSPARRAEVSFALACAPAAAALSVVAAAAAPSLAAALGLAPDHCGSHLHHDHLCLLHGAGLRPQLAALGAVAVGVFSFRAFAALRAALEVHLKVRALERLGPPARGGVAWVPGGGALCHAVGIFRPRIIASAQLRQALGAGELSAALAHERAHLARRDPAAQLLLSLAGLFAPPGLAPDLARPFHQAAEEACDAEAAHAVGDGALVAAALLQVLALRRGDPALAPLAPAFGEHHLERRVRLLLAPGAPRRATARTLALATAFVLAALAAALAQSPAVHHAVETALHHL